MSVWGWVGLGFTKEGECTETHNRFLEGVEVVRPHAMPGYAHIEVDP